MSSTVCIKKKFPVAKFLFSSSTLVLFLKYSFVCLLSHWVLYFLDCISFLTLWLCLTYSFPFAITFLCLYLFLLVFIVSLVLWWLPFEISVLALTSFIWGFQGLKIRLVQGHYFFESDLFFCLISLRHFGLKHSLFLLIFVS